MDDRAADPQAIQPLLTGILMYPLSRFTGHAQTKDWAKIPNFPNTSTVRKRPNGCSPRAFSMSLERSFRRFHRWPAKKPFTPICKVFSMQLRKIQSCMQPWSPRPSMLTRISSRPSFSFTIVGFRCRTTGPRSTTVQPSARIITAALPWPNPTSSLTQSGRPSTFIRTPMGPGNS
jgi:hypothetical protein